MAAGDLLTDVPWSHEVNAATVGTESDSWSVLDCVGWLGDDVASQDAPFDLVDGAAAGVDTVSPKVITLTLGFEAEPGATDEEAEAAAVLAGFALSAQFTAGGDVELHGILRGGGHVYLTGRCRGARETTVAEIPWGQLIMQATFVATNPVVQVVP